MLLWEKSENTVEAIGLIIMPVKIEFKN